jgi:hypothetical protein
MLIVCRRRSPLDNPESDVNSLVHRLAYNGDVVAFKMGRRFQAALQRENLASAFL